jgi:DNA-binding TFAR19-related protein (PDSD5 family)
MPRNHDRRKVATGLDLILRSGRLAASRRKAADTVIEAILRDAARARLLRIRLSAISTA